MLKLVRCETPVFYQVGTGEAGIHTNNRVKVRGLGRPFDPIYGMKLASNPFECQEFVSQVFNNLGIAKNVPVPIVTVASNHRKHLGLAFLKSNMVVLFRNTLGLMVHEVSHIVAYHLTGDNGHKQGFKASYHMMYAASCNLLGLNMDSEYNYMLEVMRKHNLIG